MLAAVVLSDLLRVILEATVAGVGVTAVFALALLGTARSVEARRSERSAGAWIVLSIVAGLGVLAAAALGIYAVAS